MLITLVQVSLPPYHFVKDFENHLIFKASSAGDLTRKHLITMGITSDILTISLILFPILAAYINPRITLSMRWQFKLDSIIRKVDSIVPKIFCALYILIDLVAVMYV